MLLALVALLGLLSASVAVADEAGWEALKRPGTVAVMRHALAPGAGDPLGFMLGDCSTQRNLDARGREQARRTGEAFRERGIIVDRVATSQWCRARETAELLGLGRAEELPALNSFYGDASVRDAQTKAVKAYLRALPPSSRVVLVAHQVNITALTGARPASGEMVVGVMGPSGFEVLGSILVEP